MTEILGFVVEECAIDNAVVDWNQKIVPMSQKNC